ncbi:metal ABC transporter substrate-binding protein [Thiocapsa rosea]|uniref:Zinc/manganese transport system substrate-binding protein n=1 Tax=Thiocapsa rosea TaxID=69360 RepID=A0A495V193_9GAMM|nr:metal ABC transporter substrate-binding protein [Thiocapsa rosea]RKT43104.1 zinc/manganese transport system substrate-binding protein [Thiocapsa rosea]
MFKGFIVSVIGALLGGLLALGTAQAAELDVVATSSSMGALARTVGAGRAQVTVLASPDRDLHVLQAKPTMIRALRDADLVVAVGAELEVGWLPVAIASAANPRILPGQAGYFEAAAQVDLLEVGSPADRALGDVHPVGNPHVNMDPVRMAIVASALGERMALLDPDGAQTYRANARSFAAATEQRMDAWQTRLADTPGVVLYHRDALYLLDRFGVPLLGTIEEIPGVPPTAQQIKDLSERLQGRSGVIVYAPYTSAQAPERLAKGLGWDTRRLTLDPPIGADGSGYLDHIDLWVDTLSQSR